MGKRNLVILGDDGDIIKAKEQGINLSQLFRNSLRVELGSHNLEESLTKDELIAKLKIKLTHSLNDREDIVKERDHLKKECNKLKQELDEKEKQETWRPPGQVEIRRGF